MPETTHIPAHLRHLRELRHEEDGGISFRDPARPTGAFGKELNRTKLTPEQTKWTFDRRSRMANQAEAMRRQYLGTDSERTQNQVIRDWISDRAGSAASWATRNPDRARLATGALAGLGAGGLVLGAGLGGVTPALLAALGVGGLGATLSGFGQRSIRNREQRLNKNAGVRCKTTTHPLDKYQ